MLRERQLGTATYSDSGATSFIDLPRDAVYHILRLSIMSGTWVSVQGAMGTGPTFESNFPFSLIRAVYLRRNGSDVIFQGSGAQLAKEHFYLNKSHPIARLYTVSSNVETLRTVSSRGVTIPANSDGIGSNCGGFTCPDAAGSSTTVYFDMQMDLYLQNGADDSYFSTLVDARPLAAYQLQIDWMPTASINIAGTANTSNTVTATLQVLSLDQDNLSVGQPFGTFKRAAQSYSNISFNSNNNQILLPRGNFFQGILMSTRGYKAVSATVALPDDGIIGTMQNRVNNNFYLRSVNWPQLKANNVADYGGRHQPWSNSQGSGPQGYALLSYINATQSKSELVATYVMDQFDLLINVNATTSAQNAAFSASTNPLIDILTQEIIPGVSVGASAPRGAQAGSIGGTSAKPYSR